MPPARIPIAVLEATALAPLRIACTHAVRALTGRHPEFLSRLGDYGACTYLIDPTDAPVAFLFRPGPGRPRLTPVISAGTGDCDAAVSGKLNALWQLATASADGDALFFSRAITITGNTEAILALRNAMDDMDGDLVDEMLQSLGPLGAPLRFLRRRVARA